MIITVTMNPAIDKTVEIGRLNHGGLNRIAAVEYDAGGKGINVSKTIQALGGESLASGFLGGNGGKTIEAALKEKKIRSDFIWTKGETRTNTKVCEEDGTVTELNERGPFITAEESEALLGKLETYAGEDTLYVLAGSVPENMGKDIYARIIERVRRKKSRVILDADGDLFREGIRAKPDLVKPNQWEMEEYAGLLHNASEGELLAAAGKLTERGIGSVVISMGEKGALFVLDDYIAKGYPLEVKVNSSVGAGDAMAAAMAYGWDKGMDREDLVRLCMAVSAGAVTTKGTKPPDRELVEELEQMVRIERIK